MNKVVVITSVVLYLSLLFFIAWGTERLLRRKSLNLINHPTVYALSLAVYCTAWTYYGSVGRAAKGGMEFLTVYIGPTLTCVLFYPILLKILRISRRERINSIADFVAARYGKNFTLGIIVTLCCVIGIIPYIALQLKAVSSSYLILTNQHSVAGLSETYKNTTLYVVVLLGLFIMFFGTRRIDVLERHTGLVAAVAFESLVKLIAFLAAGIFVTWGLFNGFTDIFSRAAADHDLVKLFTINSDGGYGKWLVMLLLPMFAMILLPRQFQMAVVENLDEAHLKKASWQFPLYLFLINIFVLPIALGGLLTFKGTVDPDSFVLALPLHFQQSWLGLFVFIGGFSAATGMIIVETMALAVMMSNHLLIPLLLSVKKLRPQGQSGISSQILFTRRISIIVVLALAFFYDLFVAASFSLVSIGLISMAAVAQFAPALIGGLFWKQASKRAAIAGIVTGFSVWIFTLIVPTLIDTGLLPLSIKNEGLFGIDFLKPQALLGLHLPDLLTHSFFWSFFLNTSVYIGVSLFSKLSDAEKMQAAVFVNILHDQRSKVWQGTAAMKDLRQLLKNFLGAERANNLLQSYAQRHQINLRDENADPRLVLFTERILSGVIGSASARLLVSSVAKEEVIRMEAVMTIARESQQVLELNKELKKKSVELTKASEQLLHANEQLRHMDVMKDEFLYTVTHELRTPLTSIRALSEIIHDNPDMDEETRQHYVSSVVKETERLTHLITSVLSLERYESGRQKLHIQSVHLNQLLQEVTNSLQPLASEKQISIRYQPPDTMFILQCDADLIRQVLYNLVSNALKFVKPAFGVVDVRLRPGYEEVQIWVEDNGRGIEPELHELIFDKFFQARNQTLKKPEGSGLGLAISKRIVEMHGGRIWVESQPEQGSKFVFTLPAS